MVVKTPFPVSLLLTAESFLNIPKSELFILNSKPEIGGSAFRGGIKKALYKLDNSTTSQSWLMGEGGKEMQTILLQLLFISKYLRGLRLTR